MSLHERIEKDRENIIQTAVDLIRIKSVEDTPAENCPFGKGAADALHKCLEIADSMGFKTVNVDNMVGYCEYGEGDEMIAVLGHVDVVPEGDGWSVPPYEGVIKDGRLYGRGSIDDKGPVAASLHALKAIRDEGLAVGKRIRIIFGTNEETGSKDMKYYVEKGGELPVMGITPDGEYPIINGEKGIINTQWEKVLSKYSSFKSLKCGIAHNVVPAHAYAEIYSNEKIIAAAEKINFQRVAIEKKDGFISLEAQGVGAHGSTPEKGINAIGLLFKALALLPLEEEDNKFVSFINEYIGMESDGKPMGINLRDELSGGLTFLLGIMEKIENKVIFKINMRYPVTCSYEECFPRFHSIMTENGFNEMETTHKNKLYIDPEHTLIKKLSKVYEEETGEKTKLLSIGGGTYAKAIPNTVAFGPVFPGQDIVEHKPDEYIEIESLIKNTKILASAMYELAK